MALGADLQTAWTSAGVTPETRKRIVRTVIDEIIVRVEDNVLDSVIRWHGGDHSALKVKKNHTGQHRWSAAGETIDLVRVLARQMPDKAIASVLNRAGKTTGRGNGWTQSRVCSLRSHNAILRPIGRVSAGSAARSRSTRLPQPVRQSLDRAPFDEDGQLSARSASLQRSALGHPSRRLGSKRRERRGDSPPSETSAVREILYKKLLSFNDMDR